jgi:5'-nucleotidase
MLLLWAVLAAPVPRCVTVVGQSDLHGVLEPHVREVGDQTLRYGGLLAQSAYLGILRASLPHGVLYVDAGDLYHGTLASNLSFGRAVVAAYDLMDVAAVAVGNHEFDFGGGDLSAQDRLAVLRDHVARAKFPFLTLNVFNRVTGQRVRWPGSAPSVLRSVGGVVVGIVGASTTETRKVTRPINVRTLDFPDPAPLLIAEAADLRARGAELVVLTAHIGTTCKDLRNPGSCARDSELVQLLQRLPPGTLDVAIGGHTHQEVGHWLSGVAVAQGAARGKGLARIDVCLGPDGRMDPAATTIHPGIDTCVDEWVDGGCGYRKSPTAIRPAQFLGKPVLPDAQVVAALAPYLENVRQVQARPLGVYLQDGMARDEGLGILVAEGLRHIGRTEFGVQNLGGVRADLPKGPILFGHAYEVLPFGNKVSVLCARGAVLRAFIDQLDDRRGKPPYVAGLRVVRRGDATLLVRDSGAMVTDDETVAFATNDFLLGGGEGLGAVVARAETTTTLETDMLDGLIEVLQARFPAPP